MRVLPTSTHLPTLQTKELKCSVSVSEHQLCSNLCRQSKNPVGICPIGGARGILQNSKKCLLMLVKYKILGVCSGQKQLKGRKGSFGLHIRGVVPQGGKSGQELVGVALLARSLTSSSLTGVLLLSSTTLLGRG